jgi:transposase
VAEISTSGDSVCAVARRHGLSPQQLFGWRRQLREAEASGSNADGLEFVPAIVHVGSSFPQRRLRRGKVEAIAGGIEIEIDGVTVRVSRGADATTLMTVLRALKAGA